MLALCSPWGPARSLCAAPAPPGNWSHVLTGSAPLRRTEPPGEDGAPRALCCGAPPAPADPHSSELIPSPADLPTPTASGLCAALLLELILAPTGLCGVCLINGPARPLRDCSRRPEWGGKWLQGRLEARNPAWAQDAGSPPPRSQCPGDGAAHPSPLCWCSGGGSRRGTLRQPKRILGHLPPPLRFSQMRVWRSRRVE